MATALANNCSHERKHSNTNSLATEVRAAAPSIVACSMQMTTERTDESAIESWATCCSSASHSRKQNRQHTISSKCLTAVSLFDFILPNPLLPCELRSYLAFGLPPTNSRRAQQGLQTIIPREVALRHPLLYRKYWATCIILGIAS